MTTISPQEPKETVQKREMKTKSFTGTSMDQALRKAKEDLGPDLLHTDIVRDIHEATATAQARAADDALEEVGQRFPEESFDRHSPSIVQEAQTGTTEVKEFEEREARKAEELTPFISAALARKTPMVSLARDEIPVVRASAERAQVNQGSANASS